MIEQLTEGSFFSEAEVILSWSPFSSRAASHQTGGRSHPVTNIVNDKMSERKWAKKAGGIFETQIMQGNHFSAFRVCPTPTLIRVTAHAGNHMTGQNIWNMSPSDLNLEFQVFFSFIELSFTSLKIFWWLSAWNSVGRCCRHQVLTHIISIMMMTNQTSFKMENSYLNQH